MNEDENTPGLGEATPETLGEWIALATLNYCMETRAEDDDELAVVQSAARLAMLEGLYIGRERPDLAGEARDPDAPLTEERQGEVELFASLTESFVMMQPALLSASGDDDLSATGPLPAIDVFSLAFVDMCLNSMEDDDDDSDDDADDDSDEPDDSDDDDDDEGETIVFAWPDDALEITRAALEMGLDIHTTRPTTAAGLWESRPEQFADADATISEVIGLALDWREGEGTE